MHIDSFPKTKSSKDKVKKTFYITLEEEQIYLKAKELGIDAPKYVTTAIQKAIQDLKKVT